MAWGLMWSRRGRVKAIRAALEPARLCQHLRLQRVCRDWEVAGRPIGGGGRAQWLAPPTRTLRPDIARDDRPRARDGGARDAGDLGGVSGKFSVIIKN
jgi:hypothetical protein